MWMIEQSFGNNFFTQRENAAEFDPELTARYEADCAADGSRIYNANTDGTASIQIRGVLTRQPDIFARFFGGGNTTYGEIIAALDGANADSNIKSINVDIDSPGGEVLGLQAAMEAFSTSPKPVHVTSGGMVASAAYMLASQAERITAVNRGVMFGSVGVVSGGWVSKSYVDVTSTDAPEKRPDLSTEEGKAQMRKRLDAVHDLMVGQIATGRATDVATVNANFGRGNMLLAEQALANNMIDGISNISQSPNNPTADSSGSNMEHESMDVETLAADHPKVYAAVVQKGVDQERARVKSHITAATAVEDMTIAIGAIEDGASFADKQADYFAAGQKHNAKTSRTQDNAEDNIDADEVLPTEASEKSDAAIWGDID
jgi:ClpP class serine protease